MVWLGFEKVGLEIAKVVPGLENAWEPVTFSKVLCAFL